MELQFNSSFVLLVVLILIFFKQSETVGQQKGLFQKINDLEIEMQKENVRRREEIRELRQSANIMETSRSHTETQQQDSGKIEEVLGAFKILKRGFYEEKKVTSRLRRHVTNMQSQLDHQRNLSLELSKGVVAILDALDVTNQRNSRIEKNMATITDVLHEIRIDITDVKEIGIIMSLELNNTNERINRIENTLQSDVTESLEILNTNGRQMKAMLNETTMSSCGKDENMKRQSQLIYNCDEPDQPTSCLQVFKAGCTKSDVYGLSLETEAIKVYCDQQTDGGGWIVFQRRQDGSVNSFRTWSKYKEGFGSLTGEFWLGNENIYGLLSTSKQYELRVDLGDFEGNTAYAKYGSFRVGPERDGYKLEIDGFSGSAGDSLEYHNGRKFITKDRDNNKCSKNWKGGWWYKKCHHANLNGLYNSTANSVGVNWKHWKGYGYSLDL